MQSRYSLTVSLDQTCYKRCQGIALTSLHCLLFFDVKKQRPTTNLEKCYQCSVSIVITLDLKVCFSLVRIKINILIAPCSTNKITEISAPWWLLIKLKKFRTFSKYLEGKLVFRNGFVTCRSCRMIPIFWYYNLRHSSSCSYVRFVYAISTCFW